MRRFTLQGGLTVGSSLVTKVLDGDAVVRSDLADLWAALASQSSDVFLSTDDFEELFTTL